MNPVENRKKAHLDACLDPDVCGPGAGIESVILPFDALFEVSDAQLDTTSSIAGVQIRFPLMIGAMTGGTPSASGFNTCLRELARQYGIALCLGSMRACLDDPGLIPSYGAGDVPALFANIGASQIDTYPIHIIRETCKRLGAVGLFVHLNGFQEYIQEGGNRDFSVCPDTLASFVEKIRIPVYIKEVGSGIGGDCARRLASLPIAGIETASSGGTSWIRVEAKLSQKTFDPAQIDALSCLGYPLRESIRDCARVLRPHQRLIASGGIRTAPEIIKCLALGADLCAIAQPFYKAWEHGGHPGAESLLDEYIRLGRLVWRSTGCKNLPGLKRCLV